MSRNNKKKRIFDKVNLIVRQNIAGIAVITFIYLDDKVKFKLNVLYENKEIFNNKNNLDEIIKNNKEIDNKIKKFMKDLMCIDKNNLFFINFKIGLEDLNLKDFLNKYNEVIK